MNFLALAIGAICEELEFKNRSKIFLIMTGIPASVLLIIDFCKEK